MSGGPGGGGVPECALHPISGITVPRPGSSIDVGESLIITWSGGPVQKGAMLTAIFDIVLAHSDDNLAKPLWQKKPFSSKAFMFQSDRTGRDSVWTNFNVCGDTAIYIFWNIPVDLDFSSTSFVLIIKNVTTDTEKRVYISGPFVIQKNVASTTTTSLIATTGMSGTTSSFSTSFPQVTEIPGPSPRLSTGARAGIGIGVALAAITLVLLACWLWRRKRNDPKHDASSGAAESYQKPRLYGRHVQGPAAEIDGPEVLEADGDSVIKQRTLPRDLVELPTENFNRQA